MSLNNRFIGNVVKMMMSNMLIILSGVISGFLVPKLLGVTGYGYYKIFNLYITYIVFADIGISNGLYLLYGGYELRMLPLKKFRRYFSILFWIQIFIMLCIILISLLFLIGEYRFIFIMVAIYTVSNNIANYFEKISIMTGEFNAVVSRNILKSILTIAIVIVLWACVKGQIPFSYYRLYTFLFVLLYTILAIQYCFQYNNLILGQKIPLSKISQELIIIIKSGLYLLLADMVASLILTLDRQFVSVLFDVKTYSVYSFAYSMLRIVLLAVSAVASVIYPSLKRMSADKMKKTYGFSIAIVGLISFGCLLGYYPLCIIVEYFLPDYLGSLEIFRILFPSITVSSIISMVMINHFKALQKQNIYFSYSMLVLIVSFVLNELAYLLVKQPSGLSIASIITMIFWYIISDRYLSKKYFCNTLKYDIYLVLNIVIFYLISGIFKNHFAGLLINSLLFFVVSILFYKEEKKLLFDKFLNEKGD